MLNPCDGGITPPTAYDGCFDVGRALRDAPQGCDPRRLIPGAVQATGAAAADAVGLCMPLPMRRRVGKGPGDATQAWCAAGLPQAWAESHPDFVHALVTAHVHKVLAKRGEGIGTDTQGDPTLPVDGVATPWRMLRDMFVFRREGITNRAGLRCAYLRDGFTVWDSANWGTVGLPMRAYHRLAENLRPSTAELQVVMAQRDEHAWCRLITPDGDVTTFGAAVDVNAHKNYGPLLNTVVGTVNSPDAYEVMGLPVDVRRIPLDHDKVQQVRSFVESRAHEGTTFNWVNRNCNTFTTEVIERATGERPGTFATLQGYVMRHSVLAGVIPEPVRPLLDSLLQVGTLGMNPIVQGVAALLGGTLASNPRGDCYLENPLQLLTPLMFTDPDKLRDWVQAGGHNSWHEES